jgi:hypothetical protein
MKLATVLARLSGYLARSSDSASRQLGRLQRLVARHRYPPWRPSLPLTMWVIESLGGRLPTGSCGWALCLMKAVLVLRSREDRPCSGRVNADGSSCNLAQFMVGRAFADCLPSILRRLPHRSSTAKWLGKAICDFGIQHCHFDSIRALPVPCSCNSQDETLQLAS